MHLRDLWFLQVGICFLATTSPYSHLQCAGPELSKTTLLLTFFERRVSKGFWGFGATEEKVVWEQWKIPFLINHGALPLGEDEESGK